MKKFIGAFLKDEEGLTMVRVRRLPVRWLSIAAVTWHSSDFGRGNRDSESNGLVTV